MMTPPIRTIQLAPWEIEYAKDVAQGRTHSGPRKIGLDTGLSIPDTDIYAAMGEIAVCLYYDEDYGRYVQAYAERPGASPDLMHGGYRVSVKSTMRWHPPVMMSVPDYDVDNDIYVLVSVKLDTGLCGLRGWLPRAELLRYPAEPWRSISPKTSNAPGLSRPERKYRYVPVDELRACKDMGGGIAA